MVPLTKAANETQSEEEPYKSNVSAFYVVAISLHTNRKTAITWLY